MTAASAQCAQQQLQDRYFEALRRRWSHTNLRAAALMTFLSEAVDDADADRQLRDSGQASLTRMLEAEVLKPNLTVYEIGCGCGRVATALAEYLSSGQYVGVDLSPQYVQICRDRCPAGRFEVTDGCSLPLPSDSADLVVSFTIFCHMPFHLVWKWMADVARVLKPGGRTYLQFHNLCSDHQWEEFTRTADSWRFADDPGHPRGMVSEMVELLFSKARLRIETVHESDRDGGGPRSWFVVAQK